MAANMHYPPGPPPLNNPIAILRFTRQVTSHLFETLTAWQRDYGDFFCIRAGKLVQYFTSNPEIIYQVTVEQAAHFHKDEDYKNTRHGLARFLGNGLLVSDGEFWRRQRRLVAPALHARRIESYADTMVQYALQVMDSWRDGVRLDISREMTRLTMLIVAKTLFNADVSGDVQRVGKALEVIQRHFVDTRAALLPAWVPTPAERRARRAKRDLDDIIYRIIGDWRAVGQDRGDLLSMLLLARDDDDRGMTDVQVRDELVTLLLAGHETTANTLNWTWYLLAQHPEAEARLHAELDAVLAGRPPTLADLERLPYTEMVIKEALRLYPPAWGFGRMAIEDIEIAGYPIAKGSSLNILLYFTHRDPRWWDEPDAFRPERFSPESEARIPKYAYLPFGGGPRVCIGNSFAMMEARLLLATLASRYRLELEPGQRVEMLPLITLNPKGGLPMTLRVRQGVCEAAL